MTCRKLLFMTFSLFGFCQCGVGNYTVTIKFRVLQSVGWCLQG